MKALWRSDLGQGKHDPLEITHVVTKTGSQISADLVVPCGEMIESPQVNIGLAIDDAARARAENAGLHEVIETQMAEIDRVSSDLRKVQAEIVERDNTDRNNDNAAEILDTIEDKLADLCVALGFAARPIARTGIAELDELLEVLR